MRAFLRTRRSRRACASSSSSHFRPGRGTTTSLDLALRENPGSSPGIGIGLQDIKRAAALRRADDTANTAASRSRSRQPPSAEAEVPLTGGGGFVAESPKAHFPILLQTPSPTWPRVMGRGQVGEDSPSIEEWSLGNSRPQPAKQSARDCSERPRRAPARSELALQLLTTRRHVQGVARGRRKDRRGAEQQPFDVLKANPNADEAEDARINAMCKVKTHK